MQRSKRTHKNDAVPRATILVGAIIVGSPVVYLEAKMETCPSSKYNKQAGRQATSNELNRSSCRRAPDEQKTPLGRSEIKLSSRPRPDPSPIPTGMHWSVMNGLNCLQQMDDAAHSGDRSGAAA